MFRELLNARHAMVILVAMLPATAIAQQASDALLRRSDVGAFAPSSFRARLGLATDVGGTTHTIEVWRSTGARTLIRFLDAKERGKYLLRIGDQIWLLSPNAKKPVHLNPSYRLYGGATIDEVLGVRLANDYRIASTTREHDPAGTLVAFELRAKSDQALFPQVRYSVREATERAVKAVYRLRSGRDATAIDFLEWNEKPLTYARRLVVTDLLRHGARTEVRVLELEERQIPDGIFDLADSTLRRALEDDPSLHSLRKQNH